MRSYRKARPWYRVQIKWIFVLAFLCIFSLLFLQQWEWSLRFRREVKHLWNDYSTCGVRTVPVAFVDPERDSVQIIWETNCETLNTELIFKEESDSKWTKISRVEINKLESNYISYKVDLPLLNKNTAYFFQVKEKFNPQ